MSNDNDTIDTEDVKVEEEALKETPTEEIKKEIIEKYGFDPEEHEELIEKLTNDKLEDRKRLSTAIKQKRSWRDKFKSTEKSVVKTDKEVKQKINPSDIDSLVEAKLNEKLREKEINDLDFDEEIKKQIETYAKVNNVGIKEATNSNYIKFLIKENKEKEVIDDATISNKHNKNKSVKNYDSMSFNDFDLTTKEGRKDYSEFMEYKKKITK